MLYKNISKKFRDSLCRRFDYNPNIFYFSSDDFKGLNKKEYSFYSSKGHILKGNLYYYDNYKDKRIIIFEHGLGAGHLAYMKEINLLCEKGYLVLAYDHSGCGASGGDSTYGFAQSLNDLDDCVKSLKASSLFKDYDISVIGHSWGAYAALNISSFHELRNIIAISGFISVKAIIAQYFSSILSIYRKKIYNECLLENEKYVSVNAIDSLKKTKAKVLVIHSKDDKTVSFKRHFKVLSRALEGYLNIKFMALEGKDHNPNYTKEAIEYKDKFFKDLKFVLKKDLIKSEEDSIKFKKKYDWNKMTEQDMIVWDEIFKYLE